MDGEPQLAAFIRSGKVELATERLRTETGTELTYGL